jgi:hypothetical protein
MESVPRVHVAHSLPVDQLLPSNQEDTSCPRNVGLHLCGDVCGFDRQTGAGDYDQRDAGEFSTLRFSALRFVLSAGMDTSSV